MKKMLLAALLMAALLLCVPAIAEETAAVKVGDIITYGVYEQDNNLENGKEPLEWRVLAAEGDELLLITLYGIDCVPYNTEGGYARWRTASLRTWLSTEFYNTVFTDEERAGIITKEVINWREKPSTDPVILLSTDEAKRLFANHADRQCTPTAYAVAQGAYTSVKFHKDPNGPANCHWWLRTHSWENNYKGTYVAASGGVMTCGGHKDGFANNDKLTIRPSIYLSASALAE